MARYQFQHRPSEPDPFSAPQEIDVLTPLRSFSFNPTKRPPGKLNGGSATKIAAYRYSITGFFEPGGGTRASIISGHKGRDFDSFVSRMPNTGMVERLVVEYAAKNYPKRHKAKVVVWSDLTVDAVDRLNESLNADHIKQVLADIFMLDNYKENVKTGIIMDLYFYTLQFAKEQKFSPEKTSTFFSIIKKIFEVCIETPFGNLDHTFEYFKDLILCHSVNRPPYSIELFTPKEVRKITEYTINTFFRHFKMYKYAFTPVVRLDLSIAYVGMPPSPEPSEAGDNMETPADDEGQGDEEKTEEEPDPERLQAQEELRTMVKDYLNSEAKRIEGSVDQHLKAAVDSLNSKLDTMIGSEVKETKGGKKK